MNQPNAPMIATRPHTPTDAPPLLNVLRRYALLMAIGTAIGGGVAAGLYVYCRDNFPRYQSFVEFQVLAPAAPLGMENSSPIVFSQDDTSQFIHRQVRYIMQDSMLKKILESDEFRTDPKDPTNHASRSAWLASAGTNPTRTLKRDLSVTPILDSAAFRVTMTTRDPKEAYNLIKGVQAVYVQNLKSDSKEQMAIRLDASNRVLREQEGNVLNLTNGLAAFTKQLNIPALTSQHAIEVEALKTMTARWVEAQGLTAGLKNQLDNINDQMEKGTLKLTGEALAAVNDDWQIRNLMSERLNLMQDRSVAQTKNIANNAEVKAIDARIATIDEQTETMRKEIEKRTILRMQERAQNDYNAMSHQADYLKSLAKEKEDFVKLLDASLIQYQQKLDELRSQQQILDTLRKETRAQTLNNNNTDDTRIQPIVSPSPPEADDFVWPALPTFLAVGIAAGFGLSFGLSYLLALADKSVRTPQDISRTLQQPLLGFVPDESDDRALTGDVGTALITSPSSMIAESFRQIRSQLIAQTENAPISTLLVTSISPGGGASTVASNLAAGIAMNDRRVLLIDANFYRPNLQMLYNNIPAEGFTDVLADPELLESAIVPAQHIPKLHLMGAGSQLAKASSEILEGKAFRDLIDKLQSKYDLIIFDAAPLNLVADSLTLAARVDGVIAVIRAGEVSRGTVSRIREQLRQVHANLLGFILNAAQASSSGYFKENYKSFYRYAGKGSNRPNASISGGSISK